MPKCLQGKYFATHTPISPWLHQNNIYKGSCWSCDALRSHGFRRQINWEFSTSQLLLQTVSLQDSAEWETDFSFLCSGAPAEPQPLSRQRVVVHQPSLGKYRNSSATQFFSPLPDLLILGAFPRNLCWTDVVQLQIQVSSFFSWDCYGFSAYISSLGRILATMILTTLNYQHPIPLADFPLEFRCPMAQPWLCRNIAISRKSFAHQLQSKHRGCLGFLSIKQAKMTQEALYALGYFSVQ